MKLKTKIRLMILSALACFGVIVSMATKNMASEVMADHTTTIAAGDFYIGATTGENDFYFCAPTATGKGSAVEKKEDATVITIAGSGTSWTLQIKSSGKYLSLKNSKDNGVVIIQDTAAIWTSSIENSCLRLSIGSYSLQKNKSGTQFGSYGNTGNDLWLESAGGGSASNTPATVGTTLWKEDFSGFSTGNVPAKSNNKTICYGGKEITYTCTNGSGGGTTKIYNEASAGGTAPELLVAKSNGTFVASNVQTGLAESLTLNYLTNNSSLIASCSSAAYEAGQATYSNSLYSVTFTHKSGETIPEKLDLTLTMTNASKNARVDDIELVVATAGAGASTKTLQSIAISGTPTVTEYMEGEEFNPSGLVVTGTYNSGDPEVISTGITWEATPATLTLGTTSVSVIARVGDISSSAYNVDVTVTEHKDPETLTYDFDFSSKITDWPTAEASSTATKTYTLNNKSFSFDLGPKVYCNSSYLMAKYPTYIGLPKIENYKLSTVVIKNSSGCSTNTNVSIASNTTGTVTDGGTAQKFGTQSSSYTYTLTDTTVNTEYYIYITTANCQIINLILTYTHEVQKELTSIELSNQKTSYYQDDELEMPTVTAHFEDENGEKTTDDVTNKATIDGFSTSVVGTGKSATVSYDYLGTIKTATYTYDVIQDDIESISIDTNPDRTKIISFKNQPYNLSGVVVNAIYQSGKTQQITTATVTTDAAVPTTNEDHTITVKATLQGCADVTQDFIVHTCNNGKSVEEALSVTDAITIIKNGVQGSGDANNYFVKGVATNTTEWNPTYKNTTCNLNTENSDLFQLYRATFADGAEHTIQQNEIVVAQGALQAFGTDTVTYELSTCVVLDFWNANDEVESITLDASNYEHYQGEDDPKATVTAHLVGGTTVDVTKDAVFGEINTDIVGTGYTVTVSYTRHFETVSCTYTYEVKENAVDHIEIDTTNVKKNYIAGEEFTDEGLVVYAVYQKGNKAELTKTTDYTVDDTAFNTYDDGTYQIKVCVSGFEDQTFDVTVAWKEHIDNPKYGYYKVTQTSDLESGQYLVVCESGKVALNGSLVSDAANNGVAITVSDNLIACSDDLLNAEVTLDMTDGSLLGKGGKYIGHTGSSNTLNYSNTPLTNSISISGGDAVIQTGDYVLRYNNADGQKRFRYYKGTQSAVQLYKFVDERPISIKLLGQLDTDKVLHDRTTLTIDDFDIKALFNDGEQNPVNATLVGGSKKLVAGSNKFDFTYNNGEKDLTCSVYVDAREFREVENIAVTLEDLETTSATILEGEELQLVCNPTRTDGEEPDAPAITWSSSNTEIATVDQDGKVTAKDVSEDGKEVIIKATAGDGSEVYGEFELTVDNDDIVSIEVKNGPTTDTYLDGTNLDPAGLVVTATYESGKTADFAYDDKPTDFDFDITTLEAEKVDQSDTVVSVTVTYLEEFTDTFDVTVSPYMTSVELKGVSGVELVFSDDTDLVAKVNYNIVYSNGTKVAASKEVSITNYAVGTQSVTVTPVEGLNELSFTYNVLESVVSDISLTKAPSDVLYYQGDNFDKTGMEILATYSSGKHKTITADQIDVINGENLVAGTTNVTISFGGKTTTVNVKVEGESDVKSLDFGDTYNYETVLNEPYVFTGKIIGHWDSGDRDITEDVRSQIENGIDTSTLGVKKVTISYYGKTLDITVEVKYAVATSIEISNPLSGNQYVGDEFDLKAAALPENANADILWKTSDASIATVDENGHLVIVGIGEVTITAYTPNGLEDSFTITCIKHVSSIEFVEEEIVMGDREGYNTAKVNVVVGPEDAYDKSYTFTITQDYKETDGLTIDAEGNLKANKPGLYLLTVTSTDGGLVDKIFVRVLSDANVSSIRVDGTYTNTATVGEEYVFDGKIVAVFEYGEFEITNEVLDQLVLNTSVAGENVIRVIWNNKVVIIPVTVQYAASNKVVIVGGFNGAIVVGDETDLVAYVLPYNADQHVTWSTSDDSVAIIDAKGHLKVVGAGEVTITATSADGVKATYTFVANDVARTIQLDKETIYMSTFGGYNEAYVNAKVGPENALDKTYTYVATDTNGRATTGITVDSNGKITAYTRGTYLVFAVSNDDPTVQDYVVVYVFSIEDVSNVRVTEYTNEVVAGEGYVFDGQILARIPIGEIDVTPLVKGVLVFDTTKVGPQTVSFVWYGYTITITINVTYGPSTGVTIEGSSAGTYAIGQKVDLDAYVSGEYANPNVTWSSSDENVATVNSDGKVTFVGEGRVVITATTADGVKATKSFAVYGKVTSAAAEEEITLDVGGTGKINVTTNEDASVKSIFYYSNNEQGLSVDANGNLVANKAGNYEVTVVVNDKLGNKKTVVVKVKVNAVEEPVIEEEKTGCESSVVASSLIASIGLLTAAGLTLSKKRKEDK